MKKFNKVLMAVGFLATMIFAIPAQAEESKAPVFEDNQISVDLDTFGSAEKEVLDNNGNYVGTLSIQEETPAIVPYATFPLQNKTYAVNFYGVTANFGYKATVSNKRITNAYGAWKFGILWDIQIGKPVFSSTSSHVAGTASVGWKEFGMSSTVRLYGVIRNGQFVIYMSL
ncbi:DUF5626 family protein [Enterococcus faecalis]|uniref:DUF5626 family protein n=1 Tax=Enterococcus faecalis TaxID=1351 RepID=UPI002DBD0B6F|nr:DUF5626 family protein [Enterococcus faecalis]MEB7954581.1 DUF5626 family protein [Enterococcus faecalis]MEB7964730.1 DUF5626 family protein [Enterococcus faecalis]